MRWFWTREELQPEKLMVIGLSNIIRAQKMAYLTPEPIVLTRRKAILLMEELGYTKKEIKEMLKDGVGEFMGVPLFIKHPRGLRK